MHQAHMTAAKIRISATIATASTALTIGSNADEY